MAWATDEEVVVKWMEAYGLDKNTRWVADQLHINVETLRQRSIHLKKAGVELPRLKCQRYTLSTGRVAKLNVLVKTSGKKK